MDYNKFPKNLQMLNDDGASDHLYGGEIPNISLQNQDGNLLKLKRLDTFRLVIYFFPMTGSPQKKLPANWSEIPGASGCTSQNISFRDNYEKLVELNAIPIGISTQIVDDLKEMVTRLKIKHDVLIKFFIKKAHIVIQKKNKYLFTKTIFLKNSSYKKIMCQLKQPQKVLHLYKIASLCDAGMGSRFFHRRG